MKLPGVSGVYDYAGPDRNSRYRSRPCCLPPMQKRQRPDCIFSELNTQPTCTPVYASPHTSRCATQNSGPSGSLLLSRRTLAVPASCRFLPAHCIGDFSLSKTLDFADCLDAGQCVSRFVRMALLKSGWGHHDNGLTSSEVWATVRLHVRLECRSTPFACLADPRVTLRSSP
jgi:hypothetical protein